MMQVNPLQLIQAIQQGQNPQQLMMSVLENQMSNTPIGQNLLTLAKNNDANGIEQFARNMVAQSGKDFDTEFANFKKTLGIK